MAEWVYKYIVWRHILPNVVLVACHALNKPD
jgi:hypothetical protein